MPAGDDDCSDSGTARAQDVGKTLEASEARLAGHAQQADRRRLEKLGKPGGGSASAGVGRPEADGGCE